MIPQIDQQIGIFVYTTNFKGCSGNIRSTDSDFEVIELLSKKTLSSISQNGDYVVYKLKKQHIDTAHAINLVYKQHGLRLKSLGLKDALAITEQFVCTAKKSKPVDDIQNQKYSLTKFGFVNKPLTKKDMIGNHFKIRINNAADFSGFSEQKRILNFYGYQRFGSKRPVTHLVGKALVQRDFESAVSNMLSFTSKYDSDENTKIRKSLEDKSNFSKNLDSIPKQMDLERILVKEMIEHDDALRAIRALPLQIRRFFVQAYQAFLFNKTLSLAFEDNENMFDAQENDVCYDENSNLGKFSNHPKQRLAVPFIGYSYYKKTRFDKIISKILSDEDVSPKDFFIKEMQEISNEGGFRNSSIKCDDYSVNDDLVEFTLNRGSFATIVLREIMKPQDPLLAGF